MSLDMFTKALRRAKDIATVEAIHERAVAAHGQGVIAIEAAYIDAHDRLAPPLGTADEGALQARIFHSMAADASLNGKRFNPGSRNPRGMPEMIRRHGPVEATRRIVVAAQPSPFFERLFRMDRLDMSAEMDVVSRFPHLFDAATVQSATQRLIAHGWTPPD